MSKMINKILFGFCSLSLVLFVSVASGAITNVVPSAYADPAVAQDSTGNWKLKLSSSGYSLLDLQNFLGE